MSEVPLHRWAPPPRADTPRASSNSSPRSLPLLFIERARSLSLSLSPSRLSCFPLLSLDRSRSLSPSLLSSLALSLSLSLSTSLPPLLTHSLSPSRGHTANPVEFDPGVFLRLGHLWRDGPLKAVHLSCHKWTTLRSPQPRDTCNFRAFGYRGTSIVTAPP